MSLTIYLATLPAGWSDPLAAAMVEFSVNTPARQAMFLAQVLHESAGLTKLEENLHYKADTLMRLFGRHFHDLADAQKVVASGPQAIANRIYANRMDNGDEASGDGWRYRGQGPIQITGHDNYQACGAALGIDLLAHPEQLQQPGPGSRSAGWYWLTHGCNELADKGNFVGVCGAINTGNPNTPAAKIIGLADRQALLAKVRAAIGN